MVDIGAAGPGIGGFGGLPGFPGFGGNLGLNIDGGFGGGLGGLGGLGGFAPYIPVTPLGALGGIKGDLILPVVAVGVALFLLLIIVLAVKAALAWKLELLDDLADNKKYRRDVSSQSPVENQEQMNQLTSIVMAALENENCSQKILCHMGTYARGTSVPAYMSWLEAYMSEDYKDSLALVKNSAEGKLDCSSFKCGASGRNGTDTEDKANQVPKTNNQQPQGFPQKKLNETVSSNNTVN